MERERYGPIGEVQWRRLLERWSKDYGFVQSNTAATFLEPRGLSALIDRLAGRSDSDYVATGSLAAKRVDPYASSDWRPSTSQMSPGAHMGSDCDRPKVVPTPRWLLESTTSFSTAPRWSTACGSPH